MYPMVAQPGFFFGQFTFSPLEATNQRQLRHVSNLASSLVAPDGSWRTNTRNMLKSLLATGELSTAHLVLGFLHMTDARKTDVVSLNLIMSGYKRRNKTHECMAVFQQMRMAGVAPDGVSFNIVIDACGKARQLQLAFHYLAEMRLAGWPPTVSTYTSLIDACGKSFELDLCVRCHHANPLQKPSRPRRLSSRRTSRCPQQHSRARRRSQVADPFTLISLAVRHFRPPCS